MTPTSNGARATRSRRLDAERIRQIARRIFAWKDPAVLEAWRLTIAYAQIGGAVVGVLAFGTDALVPGAEGARAPFEHMAALAFCALGATAGWLLLNKPRLAFWPSVATLLPQALWVYTPWASLRIATGLALLPSWTTGRGFDVIIGGTAAFRLAHLEPSVGYGLGINLWSLVALAALTAIEARRRAAPPRFAKVEQRFAQRNG